MTSTERLKVDSENSRYLSFSLGAEEFAIPLLSVKEVIAVPEITPVPQTPSYFLGIMNLRGIVISVMDLRTRLSIKPSQSAETAVIICDLYPNSVGVIVDSINSVLNPQPNEISERPELQNQKNSEYIRGVFRAEGKLVLLLDIAKTLNMTDHQTMEKALAAGNKKQAA